jgi:hypothetical protein
MRLTLHTDFSLRVLIQSGSSLHMPADEPIPNDGSRA